MISSALQPRMPVSADDCSLKASNTHDSPYAGTYHIHGGHCGFPAALYVDANTSKGNGCLHQLGVSKGSLFLQTMTESLTLFVLSALGAAVICGLFAGKLMDRLFSTGDLARMASAHLEPTHLLTLFLLGSAIVLVTVGLSVFSTLRANPRDTLARMEG